MKLFAVRSLRLYRLWTATAWILVTAVIVVSLLPRVPTIGSAPFSDKINHVAAYFVLMLWFGSVYRRESHIPIAILLILIGVLLEFAQGLIGSRSLELLDMASNSLGVAVAWLLSATPVSDFVSWVDRKLTRSNRS